MNLRPEQLPQHLKKTLAPIYLIGGDEPLLVQEAADAVRARARAEGYDEREVLDVDKGFDWDALSRAAANLSLFGTRRILELRMPGGKPDKGAAVLVDYARRPAEDTVLLVICGKLDTAGRKSKWYTTLESAGVAVQVWPVPPQALPEWITQRLRTRGLGIGRDAAALLAERVEGNLLACAQEIDKLVLLQDSGSIDLDTVGSAVCDSSRFNVFDLADTVMAAQAPRAVRILNGLRGEGVEPVLVLWALSREVRALATMATELARGERLEAILAKYRVWDKRKVTTGNALRRLPVQGWRNLLRRCARLDAVIKGARPGNAWDELLQLALLMCGTKLQSSVYCAN